MDTDALTEEGTCQRSRRRTNAVPSDGRAGVGVWPRLPRPGVRQSCSSASSRRPSNCVLSPMGVRLRRSGDGPARSGCSVALGYFVVTEGLWSTSAGQVADGSRGRGACGRLRPRPRGQRAIRTVRAGSWTVCSSTRSAPCSSGRAERRQRLGDRLAGTLVVRVSPGPSPAQRRDARAGLPGAARGHQPAAAAHDVLARRTPARTWTSSRRRRRCRPGTTTLRPGRDRLLVSQ